MFPTILSGSPFTIIPRRQSSSVCGCPIYRWGWWWFAFLSDHDD